MMQNEQSQTGLYSLSGLSVLPETLKYQNYYLNWADNSVDAFHCSYLCGHTMTSSNNGELRKIIGKLIPNRMFNYNCDDEVKSQHMEISTFYNVSF